MKDREFEFRRKDDYKDEVIAWIKCLKERHEDILFIPNTDCIKGYYKGLVLYEKITDRCRNLVRRCSDKPLDEAIKVVGEGMPKDRERRTQQIIALNNMTFDKDRYSVCGFETTVSQKDVRIPKKPEIDLVIINPSIKSMLLVEYKCKGESMLYGEQNIECHYNDYKAILDSAVIKQIKKEMIKSYILLCKINDIKYDEKDFNADDYKVQIAFLFVDKVLDKDGNVESVITDDDYEHAMNMFNNLPQEDLKDVLYIRCETAEIVNLDQWKNVKNSDLKKTI